MANAADLRRLAKETAQAYDDRISRIIANQKEIARLLDTFRNEDKARTAEVSQMLKNFDQAHAEMSAALRAALAEVKPTLEKNEADRRTQTQAEIEQRKTEASKMLEDFKKERMETAAAWQELVATMQKRRGEVPPKVAPPKKVIEEVRAPERIGIPREAPQPLSVQVLNLVEEHPGVKLSEMERMTGKARIVLANAANDLINQGKLVKEGSLYFIH